MESVFLVPMCAVASFMLVGNAGRRRCLQALPWLSLAVIVAMGGWETAAAALLLIVPGFLLREWLGARPATARVGSAVALVVLWYAVLKDYFGIGQRLLGGMGSSNLTSLLQALGLSFVVFRVVEYLLSSRGIDMGLPKHVPRPPSNGGRAMLRRLHAYVGFCLAYPAFTSGPILRWRGYTTDYWDESPIFCDESDIRSTLRRIANGLLKLGLVSQPLLLMVNGFAAELGAGQNASLGHAILFDAAAIFYLHFLYLNFASFSEVMIGAGRFIGLRLPENFDRPFTAKGFLEFWSHWNLSVSFWFRDLMFTPIVKQFVMRGVRSNTVCSSIAYVLTFGTLGLWHGRTWPFLLCGLMLALGALGNQLYRDFVGKSGRVGGGALQRAGTYLYISLAILGLWLPSTTIAGYWSGYRSWQPWLALPLVVIAYGMLLASVDACMNSMPRACHALARAWQAESPWLSAAKVSLAVLFWAWFAVDGQRAFVYEGF